MNKPGSYLLAAVIALMTTSLTHGQDKPAPDKPSRPTFEVASIRLAKPGTRGGFIKALPGGREYTAQNIPVKLMISLMYKVPMRQITGGPDWLTSDFYDVEAKADGSYNIDELHVMYQNLLADRFNLKFHKESKEGNVFALTVDKIGSKMKVNETEQDFKIPINFGPDGVVIGTRVPMSYFCWWLGQNLQRQERPVIDLTGLDKHYDFTLTFAPDLPPDVPKDNLPPGLLDRPSLFDALKEQLGLRLQAQRGPIEYYVIDHIERPSEN